MPFKRPLGDSASENQGPPHFVRPLTDKRVLVGSRVLLECQLEGHPEPAVKWLKDGQNISQCPDYRISSEGQTFRLEIPIISESDSGRFTIQAMNAAGSKTSSCTLMVAPAPSPVMGGKFTVSESPAPPQTPVGPSSPMFVKPLQNQPLKIGGTAVLECRVIGQPTPDVAWYKNAQPLQLGFRNKVENDVSSGICCLTISMMFAEDVGQYTCKATNQHGSTETTASILHKEQYDDWWAEEQTKITKEKKKNMMSEIEQAIQRPKQQRPKGQFYRSRTERILEANVERHMSDLESGSDLHWVGSESETEPELADFGGGSSYGNGAPGTAPNILSQLKPLRVSEGQEAILQASIQGNPRPKVYWFKNGQPLSPSAGSRYSFTYKGSMVILKVKATQYDDVGLYAVMAENQYGRAQSETNLEVVQAPSRNYAMQREAQDPRKPVVGYRTPSRNIDAEPIRSPLTLIDPLAARTAQPYGQPQQQQRTVATPRPPQFAKQPSNLSVNAGETARFDCKVSANPRAEVDWIRSDGQRIVTSAKYGTYSSAQDGYFSLQINDVRPEDANEYFCVATNEGGQIQARCLLEVIEEKTMLGGTQPNVVENFQAVTVKEGDSLTLFCKASGDGVQMQWFKDDVPQVLGQTRYRIEVKQTESTLQIVNAQMSDTGWYQCNASNASGTTSLRGMVQVTPSDGQTGAPPAPQAPAYQQYQQVDTQQKSGGFFQQHFHQAASQQRSYAATPPTQTVAVEQPRFTSQLQSVNAADGQGVRFECRYAPVNDAQMQIYWLHNGHQLPASSRIASEFDFGSAVLEINPVGSQDSGAYSCVAVNSAGRAETQAQLNVSSSATYDQAYTTSDHATAMDQIYALEQRRHRSATAASTPAFDEMTSVTSPQFAVQLKPIQVNEGRGVHFEGKLVPASDPNMRVEWHKDGQPLRAGSRFRVLHDFGYVALDITHTIPEDSGVYTCRAINTLGTAESSATLTVDYRQAVHADLSYVAYQDTMYTQQGEARGTSIPKSAQPPPSIESEYYARSPSFLQQLKDTKVREGGRAVLEAKVLPENDPGLTVLWLRDGQEVTYSSRVQLRADYGYVSLAVQPADMSDSGIYTCVLRNRMGQAESQAAIIVQGKRPVERPPQELPQLLYLEKKKIKIGPEEVNRPEELGSLHPPRFTHPLNQRHNGVEGQPIHFECRAAPANDPKMHFEWYKDGRALPAAHRFRPMNDFGYVALDILYAYAEDSGVYTVVATNELGSVQTETTLDVTPARSQFTEAQHPDGYQQIQKLEKRRTYKHEEMDSSPDGPPQFMGQLRDQQLREGQNLHLELRVAPVNDPTMRIDWFCNGQPLSAGSRVTTRQDFGYVSCDIHGTIANDSGVYACRAVNALGEAIAECQIHVMDSTTVVSDTIHNESLGKIQYLERDKRVRSDLPDAQTNEPPVFVQKLPASKGPVPEGASLHLEAQIQPTNDPNMQVQWLRNGKAMPHGHRFRTFADFGYVSLDILNMYAEDSGVYTCVAQNAFGNAQTQCEVVCSEKTGILSGTQHPDSVARIYELEGRKAHHRVEHEAAHPAPEFIRQLQSPSSEIKEGKSVHLECQCVPTDDPNLQIEWLLNGKPLITAHRFRLTHDFGYVALDILYMYQEDSGTYTCMARNRAGEAVTQAEVVCGAGKRQFTESYHPNSMQRIQQLETPRGRAQQDDDEGPVGPPKFVRPLPETVENLKEAQTVHLECQLLPANDPSMRIIWLRDGEVLPASHRFAYTNDFGYVALDVLHVYPEDTGVFTCRAVNSQGTAETNTNLRCIERKDIYTESQHPESWKRIRELEAHRQVRASEPERAKMAPIFKQQLICPPQVKEGQAVHMECVLQPIDDPTINIEWLLNGRPILMGSRLRTMHDFGYVALEIYHVHPEDDGVYTCRATNSLGTAETQAKLTCSEKEVISYDTLHPASMDRIKQLERRPGPRGSSPEQKYPPPAFTQPLQENDALNEGETLRLQCRLEPANDPSLTVHWLRNGQPLPQGSRFMPARNFDLVTLDILTVYAEDSASRAMYTDAVHEGSWQRIQQLEQRRPKERLMEDAPATKPQFIVPLIPDLGEIAEGAPVHMECQVEPITDPKLTVQWYCNDKPLVNAHRFRLTHDFGYVALDILYSFPQDSGVWKAVAKNELGEAQTQCQFVVSGRGTIQLDSQHPESMQRISELEAPKRRAPDAPAADAQAPKFLEPIEPVRRVVGQAVHFETRVVPIDDAALTIQWYRNGQPLPYSNRISHTVDFGYVAMDFQHVTANDAGKYKCVASNRAGQAEIETELVIDDRDGLLLDTQHPASLERIRQLEGGRPQTQTPVDQTHEAPVFTQQLNGVVELVEGQPAHFEALVAPITDPNLRIEWFHNGRPLSSGSRKSMRHDFGLVTLDFAYVLPEDQGEYECRAQNKAGQAVTKASLKCSERGGVIGDTMHQQSWSKIQEIEAPRAAQQAPGSTVYAKPSFTQPLNNIVDAAEGGKVVLEARLIPVNDPKLQLEWYFNDQPMVHSNRTKMVNDFGFVSLEINDLKVQDVGHYFCRAVNALGEAVSTASISVVGHEVIQRQSLHPQAFEKVKHLESLDKNKKAEAADQQFGPPHFTQQLKNIDNAPEGQAARLECHYEPQGDPTLKLDWLLNGEPLKNASKFHLENNFGVAVLDIAHLQAADSGAYTCRLVSAHGDATTSATVKVQGYESLQLGALHPKSWQKIQQLETPKVIQQQEQALQLVKPHFVEPPANIDAVVEGQQIYLEATFEPKRDNQLQVEWFKNGEPIQAGALVRTKHELGNAALQIDKAHGLYSGVYTIKISNEVGEAAASATVKVVDEKGNLVITRGDVVSDTQHADSLAKIQQIEAPKPKPDETPAIQFPPPNIKAQLSDVVCGEGEPVKLSCQFEPADDNSVQIQWLFNSQPVKLGSRHTAGRDFGFANLALEYANAEDSGIYQCVVTNASGEAVTSASLKCTGQSGIVTDTQHEASVQKIKELEAGKPAAVDSPTKDYPAPKFITELKAPATVPEGHAIHMEATVLPNDDPALRSEWLLNGQPVPASSRLKLLLDFGFSIIDIVQAEQRDAAGEARSSTQLSVVPAGSIVTDTTHPASVERIRGIEAPKQAQAPIELGKPTAPVFISEPTASDSYEEGDSVHLEAQVMPITDPKLKIEWLHNGQPMKFGARFRQIGEFGFCVLDILSILTEDSGEYTCRATNELGTAETKVTIKCAPKSGLILKPQVKDEKSRAIADLEAKLQKKPTTQDVPLQKMAPAFVESLTDQPALREGGSAYFSARYTPNNDADIKVEWFVNGRSLRVGSRVKCIADFGMAILEINPVYPEDSGDYVCRASNALGEATTTAQMKCQPRVGIISDSQLPNNMAGAQEKIVKIEQPRLPPPGVTDAAYYVPRFVTQPQSNLSLKEGMLAHLECQVEPVRDPTLSVEWYQNGEPITHSNRIRCMFDFGFAVLELQPVQPQDNGIWECRARNQDGEAKTQCEIRVAGGSGVVYDWQRPESQCGQIKQLEEWLRKPKEGPAAADHAYGAPQLLTQLPQALEVAEGTPAHFECQVEPVGDTSMRIEWLHNDQPIPYSSRMQINHNFGFAVLDINYCIPEDAGVYKLRVTNAVGRAESACQLGVKSITDIEPPVVITPLNPKVDEIVEGDIVHLECRVGPINDSRLSVQWLYNNQPLLSSSRFKTIFDFGFAALDILHANGEDSGVYECRATNLRGTVSTKTQLTVSSRPGLIFQRQVPLQSTMDLQRYLKQYTSAEIKLTENDLYKDGEAVKPEFVVPITEVTVEEGGFARFEGQLKPVNDPYMKLEWFYNEQPVMMGHRFRTTLESGFAALDLLYAISSDAGEYIVRASNKHGHAICKANLLCATKKRVITENQMPQGMKVSDLAKLEEDLFWAEKTGAGEGDGAPKTKVPPVFTVMPHNVQADETSPARFECAVTGFPRPKINWFHNGQLCAQSSRYKLHYDGMFYLTILNCRPGDAGVIEVTARNVKGQAQAKANLDVRQSNEIRNIRLKSAHVFSEEQLSARQQQWDKEMAGTLGEHFKKVSRKPDPYRLRSLESRATKNYPLETDELKSKFTLERDDAFYEKIIVAERNRPQVGPLPVEWNTSLKKAEKSEYAWQDEGLPDIQLKPVPPTERPAELPREVTQLKPTPKKRETSEERQIRLGLRKPEDNPKGKVALKHVAPKQAKEPVMPERMKLEKPKPQPTPKQEPAKKVEPPAEKPAMKKAFKPKPVEQEKSAPEPVQLKETPQVEKTEIQREQISTEKLQEVPKAAILRKTVQETEEHHFEEPPEPPKPKFKVSKKKIPKATPPLMPEEPVLEKVQLKSRKPTEKRPAKNKSQLETVELKKVPKVEEESPVMPDREPAVLEEYKKPEKTEVVDQSPAPQKPKRSKSKPKRQEEGLVGDSSHQQQPSRPKRAKKQQDSQVTKRQGFSEMQFSSKKVILKKEVVGSETFDESESEEDFEKFLQGTCSEKDIGSRKLSSSSSGSEGGTKSRSILPRASTKVTSSKTTSVTTEERQEKAKGSGSQTKQASQKVSEKVEAKQAKGLEKRAVQKNVETDSSEMSHSVKLKAKPSDTGSLKKEFQTKESQPGSEKVTLKNEAVTSKTSKVSEGKSVESDQDSKKLTKDGEKESESSSAGEVQAKVKETSPKRKKRKSPTSKKKKKGSGKASETKTKDATHVTGEKIETDQLHLSKAASEKLVKASSQKATLKSSIGVEADQESLPEKKTAVKKETGETSFKVVSSSSSSDAEVDSEVKEILSKPKSEKGGSKKKGPPVAEKAPKETVVEASVQKAPVSKEAVSVKLEPTETESVALRAARELKQAFSELQLGSKKDTSKKEAESSETSSSQKVTAKEKTSATFKEEQPKPEERKSKTTKVDTQQTLSSVTQREGVVEEKITTMPAAKETIALKEPESVKPVSKPTSTADGETGKPVAVFEKETGESQGAKKSIKAEEAKKTGATEAKVKDDSDEHPEAVSDSDVKHSPETTISSTTDLSEHELPKPEAETSGESSKISKRPTAQVKPVKRRKKSKQESSQSPLRPKLRAPSAETKGDTTTTTTEPAAVVTAQETPEVPRDASGSSSSKQQAKAKQRGPSKSGISSGLELHLVKADGVVENSSVEVATVDRQAAEVVGSVTIQTPRSVQDPVVVVDDEEPPATQPVPPVKPEKKRKMKPVVRDEVGTRQIIADKQQQQVTHEKEHKTAVQAPGLQQQLQPQATEPGKSVVFGCTFGGTGPITVTWLKDGKPIGSNVDYQINTDEKSSSLTIPKAKQEHLGNYTCRIENVGGSVDTTANLQILEPQPTGEAPAFTKTLQAQQATQGHAVQFDVDISADPKPQVLWFKDGKPLHSDTRFKLLIDGGKNSILIAETIPSDAGMYECIARNPSGEARCRANLVVSSKQAAASSIGSPKFVSSLQPVLTTLSDSATLACKYEGDPAPKVTWYRKVGDQPKQELTTTADKRIKIEQNHNHASLYIKSCASDDAAEYSCQLENDGGTAVCSATIAFREDQIQTTTTKSVTRTTTTKVTDLTQQDAATPPTDGSPGFTTPLDHVSVEIGKSATFEAQFVGAHPLEVAWLHNGQQIIPDSERRISQYGKTAQLDIVAATEADEGEYRVTVKNAQGSAECGATLRIAS